MNDPPPKLVLADCKHMTEPVFVDGQWRTPHSCDDCILEDARRPLTAEQSEDFARLTEQLLGPSRIFMGNAIFSENSRVLSLSPRPLSFGKTAFP